MKGVRGCGRGRKVLTLAKKEKRHMQNVRVGHCNFNFCVNMDVGNSIQKVVKNYIVISNRMV